MPHRIQHLQTEIIAQFLSNTGCGGSMIKVALLFRWYVKVNSTEIAGHCRQTKMARINLKFFLSFSIQNSIQNTFVMRQSIR